MEPVSEPHLLSPPGRVDCPEKARREGNAWLVEGGQRCQTSVLPPTEEHAVAPAFFRFQWDLPDGLSEWKIVGKQT